MFDLQRSDLSPPDGATIERWAQVAISQGEARLRRRIWWGVAAAALVLLAMTSVWWTAEANGFAAAMVEAVG